MSESIPAPQRLSSHLWRLGTRYQPSYLVRGRDRAAIFEAGVTASAGVVLAQLDALGCPRAEVSDVIVSHPHADHVAGLAVLLAGLPAARPRLTALARQTLAKPSLRQKFALEEGFTSRAITRREALPNGRPHLPDLAPPPPGPDLEPGDTLDLGAVELVFRDAAGHVPGGLFCLLPQDDAVLASDSAGFLQDGAPGFPLGYVSWDIYAQTLAGIADLSPGLLALAHQEVLTGGQAAEFLRRADESQAQEREWLRSAARNLDPEEVARAYFRRWYHGDLTVYSPRGILNCCRLLLRRALENGN